MDGVVDTNSDGDGRNCGRYDVEGVVEQVHKAKQPCDDEGDWHDAGEGEADRPHEKAGDHQTKDHRQRDGNDHGILDRVDAHLEGETAAADRGVQDVARGASIAQEFGLARLDDFPSGFDLSRVGKTRQGEAQGSCPSVVVLCQ